MNHRVLPLVVVASLLVASCAARKSGETGEATGGGAYMEPTGGAYAEPQDEALTGGAYGETYSPEESPAPAGAPYSSGSLGSGSLGSFSRSVPVAPVWSEPSRESYPSASPNPVKSVVSEPVSTFSIDVDTASYANVRSYVEKGSAPPRDAVRTEELINYFDYDYALPRSKKTPFESTVAVVPCPWKEGNRLLHIGLQGYDVEDTKRPDLNLVLLIDVSGSMIDTDRLPLLKKALPMLVAELRPRDRLSIVVYAGAAGVVLDSVSGGDKRKIEDAIERLQAGGSTAGGQGIELAYRLAEKNFRTGAVNRVILATDGDFNVGVSDPRQLEALIAKKRETGVYLSVIGVGRGNYQDTTMQKLAQAGNGNAAYLDSLSEARKVLHDEMRASILPIADDVKIQVEFNPGRVAEYRLIGYETRMLRREDFSNDRIDAGEIGAGANVTAIYELVPAGGKSTLEPLRYQNEPAPKEAKKSDMAGELAFLRIRYKPPGAKESILIERPITDRDAFSAIESAPESTRFATSVAAYGQLLRGDPYLDSSYGWDHVVTLANDARGRDEFGWRAEFVNLARQAKLLPAASHR